MLFSGCFVIVIFYKVGKTADWNLWNNKKQKKLWIFQSPRLYFNFMKILFGLYKLLNRRYFLYSKMFSYCYYKFNKRKLNYFCFLFYKIKSFKIVADVTIPIIKLKMWMVDEPLQLSSSHMLHSICLFFDNCWMLKLHGLILASWQRRTTVTSSFSNSR